LAQQLSLAYDSIRQQSEALETFTQGRTDPLTGVGNGRAMSEKFEAMLTSARRNGASFSVALVSLDRAPAGQAEQQEPPRKSRLPEVARMIESCMRDSDFVARYGDDEFAIIMPQTKLAGACIFGERVRILVTDRLSQTLACGIAEYQAGDGEKSLLTRADSALYSAKAAGVNRQFIHSGQQIREHRLGGLPRPAETDKTAASGPTNDAAVPVLPTLSPDGEPAPSAEPLAAD
jgi:diguanylate cyclase (GGDEF)-like protein